MFSVFQGWFSDQQTEVEAAYKNANRAHELYPADSLAKTVCALVQSHLRHQHGDARSLYDDAISINPSESLAWLHRGTLSAFQGDGESAMRDIDRAIALTPLDPWRYYYDSLAATAALAANRYELAIDRATKSLFAHRAHASTWRVLAIANAELGNIPEARRYALGALNLDPKLTIKSYLQRSPAAQYEVGQRWAKALLVAGVPAR